MTEPRPLSADDYETISFRAPRSLGLSAAIRIAAAASGESREALCVDRLKTSLGLTDQALRERHRRRG